MASATPAKALCSQCVKAAGILTCRGCGKDFCYRHVAEHRAELTKQMDEITTDHDLLQQTIVEQQTEPNAHPLLKQIDRWEEESVAKVQQAAREARERLLKVADQQRRKVIDALLLLTPQLSKARNDDDFVETDLKNWLNQLEKLKNDLAAAQTIDFGEKNDETVLIPRISIQEASNESFEPWFGDIQIQDSGQTILHGPTNQIATVFSKQAFSTGQHTFRIRIGRLYTNQYFVFGVAFDDPNVRSISSPHWSKCGKSLIQHGSYCDYNVFSLFSLTTSNNIVQANDILHFQLDCGNQRLRTLNERTNFQQDFPSSQLRCKLPWRMVFGLFHSGDCIHFC